MKLTLELTKRERRALTHLTLHVAGDIEFMVAPGEAPEQRARARLLAEGCEVINHLLRLGAGSTDSKPKIEKTPA